MIWLCTIGGLVRAYSPAMRTYPDKVAPHLAALTTAESVPDWAKIGHFDTIFQFWLQLCKI